MKDLRSSMNRLLTVVREDLAAQEQVLTLLEAQEASVLARDVARLEELTGDLDSALQVAAARGARRQRVLEEFGRVWGVPARAVTLGSIAERYGAGAEKLLELRAALRERTAAIMRKGRRVSALVGLHRRVTQEVLEHLLSDGDGNTVHDRGVLIDTEL